MAPDKMRLLFGDDVPQEIDLEDEDQMRELARQAAYPFPLSDLDAALRGIVIRQVLSDNPPLVWETAVRLTELGLERREVMEQLTRALAPIVEALANREIEDFVEPYEEELRALPLTSEADVKRAVRSSFIAEHSVSWEALLENVLGELHLEDASDSVRQYVEKVIDQMDTDGEIETLAGDIVVDPEQLCARILLTTRASVRDWPPVRTDFAGLAAVTDDFPALADDVADGQLLLGRMRNWKAAVEPVEAPPLNEALVSAIREAYDAESAEGGLPLTFREVTLRVMYDDPMAFDEPQLPLRELVAAAGLEIRGDLIAAGTENWRYLAHSRAGFRIADLFADDERRRTDALAVWDLFERIDLGEPEEPVTVAELRLALDAMADEDVLTVVTDQFFGYDDDAQSLDATEVFARRLTLAASRPLQRAVANVINAKVEERRCNPLAAADALAEAVREAPDFFPAADRLAWTRADQGRASEAKALWLRLGLAQHRDVEAIDAAMAGLAEHGNLRRNEPCWCGSGRKYKACHLRALDLPPLPERFRWLLRKTVSYLDRRGAPMDDVIFGVALQLANGDPDRLTEVIGEPLVLDVVLHELGWLDRFVAERGDLLPDDERALAQSWQPISRTVYEVTEVRPGEGLTLRDLRAGGMTQVVEHTASTTVTAGQMICGRAIPDGRGHQLVGSVISVSAAYLPEFLEILGDPDSAVTAQRLLALMANSDDVIELSLSRVLQERGVSP